MNNKLIEAAQAVLDRWHEEWSMHPDDVAMRKLATALAEAKNEKPPQVIVFIEVSIVDYDNETDGRCPVCSRALEIDTPCAECGYIIDTDEEGHNALDCAIARWDQNYKEIMKGEDGK
jgi:hypothetical protein